MSRPTNLLFLFTDEQRQDTMAAYGNSRIVAPNLDRLAGESVVFERAYVTQPVCTPSRASIMTGLYPHTCRCTSNNLPLDFAIPTFAEHLAGAGYRTAYLGKWHLGDEVFAQHGFEHWVSVEDMYHRHFRPGRDRRTRSNYDAWLRAHGIQPNRVEEEFTGFTRGYTAGLPAELSKPAFLAEETTRFLEQRGGEPFVAFVNFLEPHMPFTGPYNDRYDPADITLPANFDAPPHPDEPQRARLIREHYRKKGSADLDLATEAGWRRLIANYWGLVTLVDEAVGRILAALERTGAADRTIVVFTSDHGDMMGSHRLLAKTVMYEEAVKVPLLMRIPGRQPGRIASPVSQVDLVPTLLDLLGREPAAPLDGYSLRPLLEGGQPVEDHVVIEWNDRDSDEQMGDGWVADLVSGAKVRGIQSPDGWKLNLSEADKCELYHLPTDPGETQNLFCDGRHEEVIAPLRARIHAWQERTADKARV